jgi:penicillin-binding protein 1A
MTSQRSRRSRWMRILLAAAGLLFLGGAGALAGLYFVLLRDLPDLKSIDDYRPPLESQVFDRNGRPIGVYFVERRQLTPFASIPPHVVQAFVAAEDSTFFEHQGIDYKSILRAALVNLQAGGETRQGGSTITQQMVKGLLLSPERTYRRKLREMILAHRIEQRFSKQEILYLYLNQIYFGHGAYGIGEAARIYFGKPVEALSVSEAAQLAGLPKAPSHYSPLYNPAEAERRRLYVLARMREDGYLDAATYTQAVQDRPVLADDSEADDFAAAAYFTEEVRRDLFDALGSDAVLKGGLRIETTLDLSLQKAAVAALRKGLEDLDRRQGFRGMLRHVAEAEIPSELERLAVENHLDTAPAAAAETEAGSPEAPPAESTHAAAVVVEPAVEPSPEAALAALRARLPAEAPLVGVVTAVDTKTQSARVGFAPDAAAMVRLEDVRWARKADTDAAPRAVDKIERIFQVGDVARFQVLPAPSKALPIDAVGHGQLLVSLYQHPQVQGALLSFAVPSGQVLAMVGGYDFAESQFNRVTQARRQPGSAFKPMIYGAAFSLDDADGHPRYTPASIIHDRPKIYVDEASGFVWRPENYGRKFYGPITLRTALAKSVNNAAVHLCDQVGVDRVIEYARRLGIRSPLERSLALALGSSEVTLLELTRAYAVFPAGGRRVVPRFIRRVLSRDGEVLLENGMLGEAPEPQPGDSAAQVASESPEAAPQIPTSAEGAGAQTAGDPDQLIPAEDAYLMVDMLRAVVLEGTGWRLRKLARPLAGKTGTTNDQADAWFVGFSPEIATGVWVGHDESHFLGWGETGSRAAAPIWVDYMREALAGIPRRDFDTPDSILFTRIDRQTGLLASSSSRETLFQAFIAGTEPTESAERVRNNSDALRDLREDSLSNDDADRAMELDGF